MGPDPPVGEGPRGVSTLGRTADGMYRPQTSAQHYMGVTTHLGGSGNGGIGGYQGINRLPPEQGYTIYCDPSYHGIVFGGEVDAGNAPI